MPRLFKAAVHFTEQDFLIQVPGEMRLPTSSARFGELRFSPERVVRHTLTVVTASFSQPSTRLPPPTASEGD